MIDKSEAAFEAELNRTITGLMTGEKNDIPILAFGTFIKVGDPEYFKRCYEEWRKIKQ